MDRTQFVDFIEQKQKESLELIRRKNADYANDGGPFENFELSGQLGVSVEQGIVVRMADKLKRISNLIGREAKVADESIEDTLQDLSNYSLILLAYLHQEREKRELHNANQIDKGLGY